MTTRRRGFVADFDIETSGRLLVEVALCRPDPLPDITIDCLIADAVCQVSNTYPIDVLGYRCWGMYRLMKPFP